MSHSIETIKSIFSTHELGLISDLQFGIEARYNDEMPVSEAATYARRIASVSIDYSFVSAFFERYYHDEFASAELGYAEAATEVGAYLVAEVGIGWENVFYGYYTDDDERAAFMTKLIEDETVSVSELEGLYPDIFKFLEGRGLVWSED